jgi:hypothetical protein
LKIVVLTHVEKEGSDKVDPVVRGVADVLAASGHEASILAVHADLEQLVRGITQPAPDLVFNLMETFGKSQLGLVGVAGLLDLVGVPYVGCGPGEFYLQEDKGLTKKLLAFDGIRYPDFAVFGRDLEPQDIGSLRMPLIVKPLRMDASIGIDAKAIVANFEDMRDRVALIHKKIRDAALVEEYIDGREFYVGVLRGDPIAPEPQEGFRDLYEPRVLRGVVEPVHVRDDLADALPRFDGLGQRFPAHTGRGRRDQARRPRVLAGGRPRHGRGPVPARARGRPRAGMTRSFLLDPA